MGGYANAMAALWRSYGEAMAKLWAVMGKLWEVWGSYGEATGCYVEAMGKLCGAVGKLWGSYGAATLLAKKNQQKNKQIATKSSGFKRPLDWKKKSVREVRGSKGPRKKEKQRQEER